MINDMWPYGAVKEIKKLETRCLDTSLHLKMLQEYLIKLSPLIIGDRELKEHNAKIEFCENWSRHITRELK